MIRSWGVVTILSMLCLADEDLRRQKPIVHSPMSTRSLLLPVVPVVCSCFDSAGERFRPLGGACD